MSTVDWALIRAEYEAGASKQALSIKYKVSRQAIIKHAYKEHWITPLVTSPVTPPVTRVSPPELSETSDLPTVEKAILLITRRLDEEPENKDIKMLMDSLSQAYKIKALMPATEDNYAAYDMREFLASCLPEELAVVNPVIKAVAARKAEAEEKVKPIRRIG